MTICTIITKSYLAYARTLAKSILAIHPSAEIYVLLADRVDGAFDPSNEPFRIISLQDLAQVQTIEQMSFYYTPMEFCCALRGLLHQYIWEKTQSPSWIFLDSDIFVTGDLTDIFNVLAKTNLLINPQLTHPVDDPFIEYGLLRFGLFNGGFVGVRRCEENRLFIDWFRERLKDFSLDNEPGLFVDQKWLNLVPLFFPNVLQYSNIAANLGPWNVCARELTQNNNGDIHVDGKPLMFFHFSGWEINNPTLLSKRSAHFAQWHHPVWESLAMRYKSALEQNGFAQTHNLPYAFGLFDDGTPITPPMRRHFYRDVHGPGKLSTNPFAHPEEYRQMP